MSLGIRGLHFKVAGHIGLVIVNGTAKTKLATLAFLFCGEFVKNSKQSRVYQKSNPNQRQKIHKVPLKVSDKCSKLQ